MLGAAISSLRFVYKLRGTCVLCRTQNESPVKLFWSNIVILGPNSSLLCYISVYVNIARNGCIMLSMLYTTVTVKFSSYRNVVSFLFAYL